MESVRLQFDVKTADLLIWQNQVVMSRGEESYFTALFKKLRFLQPATILEVGFGLGISAALIQYYFRPSQHDILEIEEEIFKDLQEFASSRQGVRAILGDWNSFNPSRRYDFIFF